MIQKIVPQHIGIIMDGNRRWASNKNLPSFKGHQEGAETLEKIVGVAGNLGVKYLTVFALSTENLRQRSKIELRYLFSLMGLVMTSKVPKLDKAGVRLNIIGDIDSLPSKLQRQLAGAQQKLNHNHKLVLTIAVNYGGRYEIVQAVRRIKTDVSKISAKDVSSHLYTDDLPEPELIIRTGGRMRISNFLIGQAAYSEYYFTDVLWPDFDKKELVKAINFFNKQVRNFGR